jgi:hypothetical protein
MNYIVLNESLPSANRTDVGGKGFGLGRLVEAGLRIPRGFVVTAAAFESCCRPLVTLWLKKSGFDGLEVSSEIYERLKAEIGPQIQVTDAFRQLSIEIGEHLADPAQNASGVSVRSSCNEESSERGSAPGVYESFNGVCGLGRVLESLIDVWLSAYHPSAQRYRVEIQHQSRVASMAVLIQETVISLRGGAVSTLDPTTGDTSVVVIEYSEDKPEEVLQASLVDQRLVVEKKRSTSTETDSVLPMWISLLARDVTDMERLLNNPLEIEWALTNSEEIIYLQLRPVPMPEQKFDGMLVIPAQKATELRSDKIRAFQIAGVAGVPSISAQVIMPEAFITYATGKASMDSSSQLWKAFETYCSRGSVSIRPAYWSAMNSADMLPQSGRLQSPLECIGALRALWDYVIEKKLGDYTSQVAALLANWTKYRAAVIAQFEGTGDVAIVSAIFGTFEGFECCSHDIYRVDTKSLSITWRDVPEKRTAVFRPGDRPELVPPEQRSQPVLQDSEALQVGTYLNRIRKVCRPGRVEFLVIDGEHGEADRGLVLWQVSLDLSTHGIDCYRVYEGDDCTDFDNVVTGRPIVVRNLKDIERVGSDPSARDLVLLDLQSSPLRNPEFAKSIAAQLSARRCPVIYRGSVLSHLYAQLIEFGLRVYAVNQALEPFELSTSVHLRHVDRQG